MTERLDRPVFHGGMEQFAAHCAHDFNNLLTGILGNLELMQNRAKRNGVTTFDGYLEGARNAAGRAANFSQRLLAFSGRATQEAELVQVNQLAADLAELLREQDQPVVHELAADAGAAFCDPAQLELALLELLANAREASAGGAIFHLITTARGAAVEISVIDTGPGMGADILARATEPFFSTRQSGAGKGLGLAIADRFARAAGGSLEITSTPQTGTTARLILPRLP